MINGLPSVQHLVNHSFPISLCGSWRRSWWEPTLMITLFRSHPFISPILSSVSCLSWIDSITNRGNFFEQERILYFCYFRASLLCFVNFAFLVGGACHPNLQPCTRAQPNICVCVFFCVRVLFDSMSSSCSALRDRNKPYVPSILHRFNKLLNILNLW
jgi:hypothetical protein